MILDLSEWAQSEHGGSYKREAPGVNWQEVMGQWKQKQTQEEALVLPLALKMEPGPSAGDAVASGAVKKEAKSRTHPCSLSRRNQLCQHLGFTPVKPTELLTSRTISESIWVVLSHCICLRLWQLC